MVMDTVVEGWTPGRAADLLFAVRWEDDWDESLHDLQVRHGLVAA